MHFPVVVQLRGLAPNYLALAFNSCSTQHHHIIPIVIVSAAVTVLGSVLEVATMVME